jgi:hypothetical protein
MYAEKVYGNRDGRAAPFVFCVCDVSCSIDKPFPAFSPYKSIPMTRSNRIAIRCLICLAAIAHTGAASAQKRVPIPAAEKIFAMTRPAFSGDRALATVTYMDGYFRVAGNTGFNGTIHRVEKILQDAGYVEESNATAGSRLTYRIEHRPLRAPTWEPVDASVMIEGDATALEKFATNRNMIPIYSPSTPAGGVTSEVVYVGKGTAADFEKSPVRGKIAFMDGGSATAAYAQGAIGVLLYRPLPAYNRSDLHPNSIQFTSMGSRGRGGAAAEPTGWEVLLSRAAYERLKAVTSAGVTRLHVDVQTKIYPSEELTLVADVHGSVKPDERYVVSAHIQEPGANDNATGVATLSEMGRVIGGLVTSKKLDPKRTITMLFGEEIKQTADYLAGDSIRSRGVLWGLSLDMVGEDTKKTGGTFLIEKMPDPSAIWTRGEDHHTEWGGRALKKDALKPHYYNDYLLSRCLDQAAVTGWVVKTNPFEGGSDHTPFLTANKPGALFWHFTDVYYHTDGDRVEMVSPQTMTNVGNAALASVLTLVSADGSTARALVAEVERAAGARIGAELALSKAALAAGGDRAHEMDIINTWIDYYAKSIETMTDIEVGGSSPQTLAAIHAAADRVRRTQVTL